MIRARDIHSLIVAQGRRHERGQGLVEFALLVPVFLILLLGMLEFGFAFNHQLTLGYATREGARIGADLVNGGGPLGCNGAATPAQSPNAANVDSIIIQAVDRVLLSAGSPIPLAQVKRIRIFQADVNGEDTLELGNEWVPTVPTGTTYTLYDGSKINFKPGPTQTWGSACNRSNALGHTNASRYDSIGVSISYTYQMTTPLASALKLVGGGGASNLDMTDVTVMQLNPTN